MHSMSLNKFSDLMQVLKSIRKQSTKTEYFSKHILFTIIYVLQKQKLNHRNYSEQNINMSHFIQAKEYDMNMHAKIQFMNMHAYL
jgi:hypothetical protein